MLAVTSSVNFCSLRGKVSGQVEVILSKVNNLTAARMVICHYGLMGRALNDNEKYVLSLAPRHIYVDLLWRQLIAQEI